MIKSIQWVCSACYACFAEWSECFNDVVIVSRGAISLYVCRKCWLVLRFAARGAPRECVGVGRMGEIPWQMWVEMAKNEKRDKKAVFYGKKVGIFLIYFCRNLPNFIITV